MRNHRQVELEFNRKYGDLAKYNSEKSRGIIHTPEWESKMAEVQKQFDKEYGNG